MQMILQAINLLQDNFKYRFNIQMCRYLSFGAGRWKNEELRQNSRAKKR